MSDQTELSILKKEIELLRHQLIETVHIKGYTHSETIQLSQALDKLLNRYSHIQHYSCHARKVDSY